MNAEDWLHCWVRPERYYVALKATDVTDEYIILIGGWVESVCCRVTCLRFFPWLIYRCTSNTISLWFVSYHVYVTSSSWVFGWSIWWQIHWTFTPERPEDLVSRDISNWENTLMVAVFYGNARLFFWWVDIVDQSVVVVFNRLVIRALACFCNDLMALMLTSAELL